MIAHNLSLSLQLLGLAFFGSLAFCGFLRAAGLGDVPDGRSAHSGSVPTGGGTGMVAGLGLAICAFAMSGLEFAPILPALLSLAFATACLGLSDDTFTLSSRVKFPLLILIAGLAVWVVGPVTSLPLGSSAIALPRWAGFAGSILWIFVVMNAVNFMDGINGIMGVCMGVALFALFGVGIIGFSPTVLLLSSLGLAALLGFLPYNLRRRATLFSGDVGSLLIGYLFAVSSLVLVREAGPMNPLLYAGPILILPFLTDVLWTLLRRARNGENLLHSHSSHLYQRLNRARGNTHLGTTFTYGLAFLLCANVAIFGGAKGWLAAPWALMVLVVLLSLIWFAVSRKYPS